MSSEAELEPESLGDPRLRLVLLMVHRSPTPIGARTITRQLRASGLTVSESTANRLLTRLDEQGLTDSVGGRGRGLSARGRALAERLVQRDRQVAGLDALEITSLATLHDVLVARRGLEGEIVRAVTQEATDRDLTLLDDVLNGRKVGPVLGRDAAPGNRFHRLLPTLTSNRSLRVLGTMLLDDNAHEHERLLDIVTASEGGKSTSRIEHHAVLDAIRRRDGEAAQRAMVSHLDRLIDATELPLSRQAWRAFAEPVTDRRVAD